MNEKINYIGIDIAKEKFDVAFSNSKKIQTFKNNEKGFEKFYQTLEKKQNYHVAMEATGGYQKNLAYFLLEKNLDVSVINPRRTRKFAESLGKEAKTDAIDAHVIAKFAEAIKLKKFEKPSELQEQLKELVRRRNQLVKTRTQEKTRAEKNSNKFIKKSIEKIVKTLNKEIEKCENEIDKIIDKDEQLKKKIDALTKVQGVGQHTATALLAEVAEIGSLNRRSIASLCGVAPFCRESGKFKGKRFIKGGRANARSALYMATLVAARHNPCIKSYYQNLLKRGKAKKVALVACMRKLLIYLNSLLSNLSKVST